MKRRLSSATHPAKGFTLLELVVVVAVLSVLTLGIVPLVKLQVRRQKEQQLRENLREMRAAIDQFHREAVAGQALKRGTLPQQQQQIPQQIPQPGQQQQGQVIDPRVRVGIVDDKIFKTDNLDLYPPTLEDMVKGVNVMPLPQSSINPQAGVPISQQSATEANKAAIGKKKVYLRQIPIDPMTGEAEWDMRSSYDEPSSGSWGGENVFDVRSKSDGVALNGEKYSDW